MLTLYRCARYEQGHRKMIGKGFVIYSFLFMLVTCLAFSSCKDKKKQVLFEKDYIIKGSCGEKAKYKLYKDGTLEIFGKGPMANYEYNEQKQQNETPWAKYKDKINTLNIEGVSTIGQNTFGGLNYVKEISVPSSVVSVCKGAFSGMKRLEKITFQGNLDYIGEYALASCESLKHIIFEGEVKTLRYACFQNNESLEELTIPSGVTELPDGLCTHCNNLKTVKIPNTVTQINRSFWDCPKLERVKLPSSLTHIAMAAFTNDASLKEITPVRDKIAISCM